MRIEVVPDEVCPTCGKGEPEYHNRPKVHDGETWWWKCYNPSCPTDYYDPDTGRTE